MIKQISALLTIFFAVNAVPALADETIAKSMFPIGIWLDGRVEGINCPENCFNVPAGLENAKEYYEKVFTDIKQHGIDIVVIPNTPSQYRETLLTAADKVGVKIVLELVEIAYAEFGGELSVRSPYMIQETDRLRERLKDLIDPLKGHESLLFYQTIDEPKMEETANLQKVTEMLTELDPAHPAFSCMCWDKELWRTSKLGMQMLLFDRYPIWQNAEPGVYNFKSWRDLLEQLRMHSRDNDIPYWMVVQTFAMQEKLRFPTAPELRALTYLSLSRNAKGIFFFLYNSKSQHENLQGLVDIEFKPVPLWADVAVLAAELKKLGPVLLTIQPADAFASSGTRKVDVQCFANENGDKYIIATNFDVLNTADAQLKIEGEFKTLVNVLTGEKTPIENNVKLAPGNGAVLRLEQ